MKKHYLLFLFFSIPILFTSHHTFAHDRSLRHPSFTNQQQTISGVVTDENGTTFSGVNVIVKGTSNGAITNSNGGYSIAVPDANSVLVFSFVGYAVQEVSVNGRSVIDVTMNTDVKSLEEVVVTALGIKKESKKLGYSVTSVRTDELVTHRTTNVMESLEGKVAGLNITPPASGAGSSMQIRLRGQAAFAGGNNAPLIIINGLPMDQDARGANGATAAGDQTGAVNMRDRGDNLQSINPDDIESMTILKGATAAALYGARAANGAVVITTKSGSKNQGIGVDFTSSYTMSRAVNFMDEITQTEYGQGQGGVRFQTASAVQGNGQWGWGEKLDGVPTVNFDGEMRPYSAHPNQLFDFLQTGTNFTNTIGLSGGGANGSFRASFSNTDAKGIYPGNEYKKRILNVGINHDITKKLKFQLNINYSNEENINPPPIGTQGDGGVNFFTRMPVSVPLEAYRDHAVDPVTGAEWKTNGFQGTINNPYYPLQKGQFFNDDRNRLLGTTTIRYEFTDWLYAQGRFNYNRGTGFLERNELNGTGSTSLTDTNGYRGRYEIQNSEDTDINADFLVGANKEFGKFSVDASFGGNTWRTKFQRNAQYSRGFIGPDLYTLRNGTITWQNEPDAAQQNFAPFMYRQSRINSLYGLAEFGYNDLIYLNFTGRQDWFSVLNPSDNSQFYPSISGSFIFSELLQDQNWLSYGKLRGSWAQVGSANGVNTYEGLLKYDLSPPLNSQPTAGVNGNVAPNAFLKPFTVTEKEIGLEMRLFNNKVLLDVGVFDKVTTDQILDVTISNSSGYNTSKRNLASLRNRGLETLIEVKPVATKNFTWTSSWNNAYLSTKVLDVGNESGTLLVIFFNGTAFPANGNEFLGQLRYTEGLAMNQLYTATYKRNANGEIIVNDDGQYVGTDATTPGLEKTAGFRPVGSSIPKHVGGWNNTITYKNLSLGIHFDYKFGGTVLSSTLLNMTRQGHSKMSLGGREDGILVEGVNQNTGEPNTRRVTPAELQGFYARFRGQQIGDPFTFKSDFVKLRNISLSYNFTNVIRNVPALSFVKGLTLTAACRNVLIIYKDLPGLDPEAIQSSGDVRAGYENSSLPTTRNYNFSLNVRF